MQFTCSEFLLLSHFLKGSNDRDIKKAYRKLSLIYHPDKETGDEKLFMKLTKGTHYLFNWIKRTLFSF